MARARARARARVQARVRVRVGVGLARGRLRSDGGGELLRLLLLRLLQLHDAAVPLADHLLELRDGRVSGGEVVLQLAAFLLEPDVLLEGGRGGV